MVEGGCLCGAARFEITEFSGPFELCHCNRCRKVSGSAFVAGVGVRRENFRWLKRPERVTRFEAPLIERPPAYGVCFCSICGSTVPDPDDNSEWFELAAGLLDGDPVIRPDKHIFVEHNAPWHQIDDALPQLDARAVRAWRRGELEL